MPKLMINQRVIDAEAGANLLSVLRSAGMRIDLPCGGTGKCGKCIVYINGCARHACQTFVHEDMHIELPETRSMHILTAENAAPLRLNPLRAGALAAFDIGTTTLACSLLDGQTGQILSSASEINPQTACGADVVSRIRFALNGGVQELTDCIRGAMTQLLHQACRKAGLQTEEIGVIAAVGNPCMGQLFLGMPIDNLARIPFSPLLTHSQVRPASAYLQGFDRALLVTMPDISAYLGADTLACILSTQLHRQSKNTLLVDIGTNGEMVLQAGGRMVACSAAAGPALEGAGIRFGMRAAAGAIDRVWLQDGRLCFSTIAGESARGICGSGLIDAAAALLDGGLINARGRILDPQEMEGQRFVALTDEIFLTQDDIRSLQLCKGAIAAGIELMAEALEIDLDAIEKVLLAGAFGSYIRAESACRIGLLPPVLQERVEAVGNAAGAGACMLACDRAVMDEAEQLAGRIEFLELASLPGFRRCFARNMNF